MFNSLASTVTYMDPKPFKDHLALQVTCTDDSYSWDELRCKRRLMVDVTLLFGTLAWN